MGENNKQVRVDNWGIFFLSRLQAFFNKTDYCDLTLQFEGNVQLKVHRLVMNACTEYFQILEQTCEVIDDILLMPPDLQTDVILPIVNFMYTGMLEFPMSVFDKLYKTAELMNITVLLKILDAQKKPHLVPKSVVSKVPPTYNLQGKKITPKLDKQLPATLPGRKLPVWKRKSAPVPVTITPATTYIPEIRRTMLDPLAHYDNTPKPTRFEWPEEDLKDFKDFTMLDTTFDNISYSSKPLVTQEDELRAGTSFDEIKHLPNVSKKPKEYNNANVDMDDIKSYVKEQKIRSNMAEDDDDIDNDLDEHYEDLDYKQDVPPAKRKMTTQLTSVTSKKVRFSINEKENKQTKINITQTAGKSEIDHSKIISEVLKKYPHLVKKNKNIRLKILAKNKADDIKKPIIKTFAPKLKALVKRTLPPTENLKPQTSTRSSKGTKGDCKLPLSDEGPWYCDKCSVDSEQVEFVLYYLYRKHMTDVHNEKFDSRMCQYCGVRATKHNMLLYHQFTIHGIKPPAAYNFPKCQQCPYVALTEGLLIKHKLNHTTFDMQCKECKVGFNNETSLKHHIQITGHTGKTGRNNYDCQYCTKHYQTGANLFSHLKVTHREEAKRDGIVSIDDSDVEDDEEEDLNLDQIENKVKILSNVQLPVQETTTTELTNVPLEHRTDTMNNVTSGIATSLGLVDIVVLDDNQQYILHPNQQQMVTQQTMSNNQEYILPELNSPHSFVQNQVITTEQHNVLTQSMLNNSDIGSTDELVMVLTDHDYNDGNNEILTNDNSNIVVLYSHPVEGQENQFITSQGNLMLNSETGMLEIRNTNNDSIVSQGNTVESIEMIQREIDSHVHDGKTFPIVVTTSSSIVNNVGPMTQCTEILENNQLDHSSKGTADNYDDPQVNCNNDETDSYVVESHETAEKEQLEKNHGEYVAMPTDQPEPMEVDEDCAVIENEAQNIPIEPQPESRNTTEIEYIEEIVEDTTKTENVVKEHVGKTKVVEVLDSSVAEKPQELISEEHVENIKDYVPEPMEVDGRIRNQDDQNIGQEDTQFENESPSDNVEDEIQCVEPEQAENLDEKTVPHEIEETIQDLEESHFVENIQKNTHEVPEESATCQEVEENKTRKLGIEEDISGAEVGMEENVSGAEIAMDENVSGAEVGMAENIGEMEVGMGENSRGTEVVMEQNISGTELGKNNMLQDVEEAHESIEEIVDNIEQAQINQNLEYKDTEQNQSNFAEDALHQESLDQQIIQENEDEIEIHQGLRGNVEIHAESHLNQEETTLEETNTNIQAEQEDRESTEEINTNVQIHETILDEPKESTELNSESGQVSEEMAQTDEEQKLDESIDEVDTNSQNQFEGLSSEMKEDSNTLDGSTESTEKIVTEDETSQKSTENSNDKISLNPRTKISILDDWEDTDSQQSGKSGITVKKLINDWDDD